MEGSGMGGGDGRDSRVLGGSSVGKSRSVASAASSRWSRSASSRRSGPRSTSSRSRSTGGTSEGGSAGGTTSGASTRRSSRPPSQGSSRARSSTTSNRLNGSSIRGSSRKAGSSRNSSRSSAKGSSLESSRGSKREPKRRSKARSGGGTPGSGEAPVEKGPVGTGTGPVGTGPVGKGPVEKGPVGTGTGPVGTGPVGKGPVGKGPVVGAVGPAGVLVLRAGQTVGEVFPRWTVECEDKYGDYVAEDANQPRTLPLRMGSRRAGRFRGDGPLSQVGSWTGRLVGRGLGQALRGGLGVEALYASPALAALQTAALVQRSLGPRAPAIRVEPALLGWQGATVSPPTFLTAAEAETAGLGPLDQAYQPLLSLAELRARRAETVGGAYQRLARAQASIRLREAGTRGHVLLVAGAEALDAASLARLGSSAALPSLRLSQGRLEAAQRRFPHAALLYLRPPPAEAPSDSPSPASLRPFVLRPGPLPPITATAFSSAISPNPHATLLATP